MPIYNRNPKITHEKSTIQTPSEEEFPENLLALPAVHHQQSNQRPNLSRVTPAMVTQLQHTIGNKAVMRLLDNQQIPKVSVAASQRNVVQRHITYKGAPINAETAKQTIGKSGMTILIDLVIDTIAKDAEHHVAADTPAELLSRLKAKLIEIYQLTAAEVQAIEKYQGGTYEPINQFMRGQGKTYMGRDNLKELAQNLINGMNKLPTNKPKNVTRKLAFKTVTEYNKFMLNFENPTYTTPQFDSTKAGINDAEGVALKDNGLFVVWLFIEIPADATAGRDIGSVINLGGEKKDKEQEVLFPPGTIYEVTKTSGLAKPDAVKENGFANLKVQGVNANAQSDAINKLPTSRVFG